MKNLTLIASKPTVTLGKVTIAHDHPLAKDGWLAIADFDGSKHYGHGLTRQDALDDLVIRHGVQVHEVEASE